MRYSLSLIVVLPAIAFAPSLFAQEVDSSGFTAMAEGLLRQYPYVLPGEARTRLGELHRDYREAEGQLRRAGNDDEKAQLQARMTEAAEGLRDVLEGRAKEVLHMLDGAEQWAATTEDCVRTPGDAIFTVDVATTGYRRLGCTLELEGDVGAVLFLVEHGAGPTHFQTETLDFAEHGPTFTLSLPADGRTWVLAGLRNVPQLRTVTELVLQRPNLPDVKLGFDVVTPEWGRLKMAVISDDTGQPGPAMVRLVWSVDGQDRKPPTAVEFKSLFDNQGTPSGRRHINKPGPFNGLAFWCVAEPFDMALPPGKYNVIVRRGVEHVPVTDTFTVASGERIERTYRPKRWIDMREKGWYSGDDHVHCQVLSDSDAESLMAWVKAEDVHLANVVKMGDIYRTWFEQRGFGPAYRIVDDDYILSPGQECPRTHAELGHTLSMNITSMVRDTDKYYLYDWVFDTVHAQGGLSGYAHINSGIFQVHRDMSMNIPNGKADFGEVMQFGSLGPDLYFEFLNLGFPFTASAGSDVPWGGTIGEERVYAYTGTGEFSADAWFEAMGAGRTFVSNGPMIDLTVNGNIRPGATLAIGENGPPKVNVTVLGFRLPPITIGDDTPLKVDVTAWASVDRSPLTKVELLYLGEPIAEIEAGDGDGPGQLSIKYALEPGGGGWLAARAWCADGSEALTTPIYIQRKGLRFWKYDAVPALIEKRLAQLGEIDQIIDEAAKAFDEGTLDYARRDKVQLVIQGDALRERVNAARRLFEDLKATYESEAATREKISGE
ncbi:MAG: CehA/McbA family metallohydrolase [Candidatus Hydrogenedentes bacterium]|nr:CehA/McbA family metallohydrolase [Candidatus Hydrogenedentota bacterium]